MNKTKKTVEYVNKTKQDAMRYLRDAQEDVALWTMVVNECDADIKAISKNKRPMFGKARIKVMTAIALFLLILYCSSCTTVQGIGTDITWMGRAGQEALEHGHELK